MRVLAWAVCLLWAAVLPAAQVTWTGDSTVDGDLSNTDNTGGAAIGANDEVVFSGAIRNGWGEVGSPVVVPAGEVRLQYLTFTGAAGDYVVGVTTGGTLMFTQGNNYIRVDGNYAGSGTLTVAAPLNVVGTGQNIYMQNNSASGVLVIAGDVYNQGGRPFLQLQGSSTDANTVSGNVTRTAITKNGTGVWNLTGFIDNSGSPAEAGYIDGGVLNLSGTWNVGGKNIQTRYNKDTALASGTLVVKGDGSIYGFSANNNFLAGAVILEGNAVMTTNNNNLAFGNNNGAGETFNLVIKDNAQLNMLGNQGGRFVIDGAKNSVVIVNQDGGVLRSTSGLAIGERRTTDSTGSSAYNLDGGVLSVGYANIYSNLKGGINVLDNSVFYMNGGTIAASANTFLLHDNTIDTVGTPGMTNGRFVVRAGGARFDSNGYVITVSGTLEHDSTVERDGGLLKSGEGTLLLSDANTYNGGTIVSAGVLQTGEHGTVGLGDVRLEGGAMLMFGNALSMDGSATLRLFGDGGSAVVLNYSDSMTIAGLYNLSSGTYLDAGVYNASELNGALGYEVFTGVGSLNLLTIPEPSAWLLLLCGAALIAGVVTHKRAGWR